MPLRPLVAAAAVCFATGAIAQQPPPLTEAEALGLIDLTVEEIAEQLEARVNAGLPEATDLNEAIAAFEAFAVDALARVEAEHGWIWTQFDFDIDRSLWGDPAAAADEGWTPEKHELALAEYRDAVAATVTALTTPEALRLIDRMAASAPMRVTIDADAPIQQMMSPSRPGRFADGAVHLPGLLSRTARDAAKRGDDDAAVAHLARLHALAGVMQGHPRNLITGLNYLSWVRSLAEFGVRPALASGALSADDCRELRAILQGVDCLTIGRAASDAEMFVTASIMRGLVDEVGEDERTAAEADWRLTVGLWASLNSAYTTPIGAGDHWKKAAKLIGQLAEQGGDLAAILAPAWMRVAFSTQIAQLEVEASVIMLALEEHRLDRGSHPATLDDLVPRYLDAVPIDPLTGEQFRYIRTVEGDAAPTTGYTLYSIGSDMHDDGGAVDPRFLTAGLGYDIATERPYDHIFNRPYPLPGELDAE
ncbi:MAG: hypothetical protein ACF8QF_02945 [Phycisphaerales bacterium]